MTELTLIDDLLPRIFHFLNTVKFRYDRDQHSFHPKYWGHSKIICFVFNNPLIFSTFFFLINSLRYFKRAPIVIHTFASMSSAPNHRRARRQHSIQHKRFICSYSRASLHCAKLLYPFWKDVAASVFLLHDLKCNRDHILFTPNVVVICFLDKHPNPSSDTHSVPILLSYVLEGVRFVCLHIPFTVILMSATTYILTFFDLLLVSSQLCKSLRPWSFILNAFCLRYRKHFFLTHTVRIVQMLYSIVVCNSLSLYFHFSDVHWIDIRRWSSMMPFHLERPIVSRRQLSHIWSLRVLRNIVITTKNIWCQDKPYAR